MPSEKTIELRVRALLTDSDADPQQTEAILKLWRDNYKAASELAAKNCLTLVFLVLVFVLLATASLTEVSLFGLKFSTASVPMAIVHATNGFLLYRVVSLFMFATLISEAIREADYQLLRAWSVEGLTDLTEYPGLLQIENSLANIEHNEGLFKTVSNFFLLTTVTGIIFLVAFWLYWGGRVLLDVPLPLTISIPAIAIAVVFSVRAALVFVQAGLRGA